MGALLCTNEIGVAGGDDPNLIIDIERVLTDSAWQMFLISHGKIERRFLKRKRYRIDVPMNYFHFEEIGCVMNGRAPRQQGATGLNKENMGKSGLSGVALANSDRTSPGHIGLETEFNNDTDNEQTYTFSFEKVRTAAVEVTYQKGFSIGGKANFSIGLPKVLGDGTVGVELDKQLQISKATGERFEESLRTSASSDIKVQGRKKYIASVVMEERALLVDFKVTVEMSMPAKKAPTYITDLKTGEVIFVRTVQNLPRAFKDFSGVMRVKDEQGKDLIDRVQFQVEGIVDGVQLSTHKINLYSSASVPASKAVKEKERNLFQPATHPVQESVVVQEVKINGPVQQQK